MTRFLPILLLVVLCTVIIVTGELSDSDGKGTLEVSVLCHNNVFSKEVLVQPGDAVANVSYSVQLNPSGKYEGRWEPGVYVLWLLDGNGGQSEYATATVYAGYQTKVTFIGHAISNRGKAIEPTATPTPNIPIPEPTPTQTPVCYQECYEETIHHPEINHTITKCGREIVVVDRFAWDETIWLTRWRCDDLPHGDYCIS